MSDTDAILAALKDHREETRQDMHELRGAVVKIADAAADMGKTMARSEERHSNHEDVVKRLTRTVDDHEARIRATEANDSTAEAKRQQRLDIAGIKSDLSTGRDTFAGGWKVITVMAALVTGIAALTATLIKIAQ